MKKIFRCHVKLSYNYSAHTKGFTHTHTGKRKVWYTTKVTTYCCSSVPCYFIWEKSTKHNGHNPYSGYIPVNQIVLK